MIARAHVVAIALVLCGCPSAAPDHAARPSHVEEPSMTPFQEARRHFARALTTALGHDVALDAVSPQREDTTNPDTDRVRTGQLFAFLIETRGEVLHGYASASGDTLLWRRGHLTGDLATLLRESGALSTPPAVDALALAERVVWLLGDEYTLIREEGDFPGGPEGGLGEAPALAPLPGGGIRLTFDLRSQDLGAPPQLWRAIVTGPSNTKLRIERVAP